MRNETVFYYINIFANRTHSKALVVACKRIVLMYTKKTMVQKLGEQICDLPKKPLYTDNSNCNILC